VPGTWVRNTDDAIPGSWVQAASDVGKYRLVGCPPGHQTLNNTHDTQQCLACNVDSQYIIDPDTDACQKCPPGLRCKGNADYEPEVQNSTWSSDSGVYRLERCPRGYARRSIDDGTDADQQRCVPCPAGTECMLEVCNNYTCSECQEGTYKDAAGTQGCRACPENTFNPNK
jgi:hypothetical protein